MRVVPLSQIAEINPRGDRINEDDAVSFVGMADLDAVSAIARPSETRLFGEVSKGYTVFRDQDFLVAKITPCFENGKVGQAVLDHKVGAGSTEFHVVRPREDLDPRFLLHFLRRPQFRATGELRMTGSGGQRRVPADYLRELAVPLPSLPEQRRVAAILDHADALRAKRHEVLAHLDSLPQSIFHDMFGDVARQHSWPVVRLGEVAESRLGKMLDRKRQTGSEARPYLRNANVQWFSFDLTEVLTMDFDVKDRAELLLRRGDVLVCEGGRPGRAAIWREELEECYFQKALHRVRCGQDLEPEYFVHFMWAAVHGGALKDFVTSATIAHLTGEKLRTLPVALPPISLQKDFAARVAEIRRNRSTLLEATRVNDHLFAALQFRAFRGEL